MVSSGIFTTLLLAITSVKGRYVAVTGLTNGVNTTSGARPVRQNINTLANSGPAWNLYVQALSAFQADGQADLLSYYEIAGIHGRPYTSWDNVNGANGDYSTGYCTHDSILFPIWHRPYMALYETTLYNYVQQVAAKYTGSNAATYQAAANTWRMPYWDWASTPQMPASVTAPVLSITGPSGSIMINNPLYNYTFHPLSTSDFPSNAGDAPQTIISAPATYRDASNGISNENYVNQQLAAAGLTASTYNTFTRATTYSNYATQANSGSSIESVHGTIHVTVGQSNGHMTYIPYSAYDPIFWLHHTNVDRLFAMWQAIYPDQYVTPHVNNYGTFTEGGGTTEDMNTNLTPFTSNTAGSFWTAASSRQLSTWGYTYPEIQDWNQTPDQLAASVKASVNSLYNPQGTTATTAVRPATTTAATKTSTNSNFFSVLSTLFPRRGARTTTAAATTTTPTTKTSTNPNHFSVWSRVFARADPSSIATRDTANSFTGSAWFAHISVDKVAVGGPFKLFMFIGSPPSDPTIWATAWNLVAVQGYFSPVVTPDKIKSQTIYSDINLEKAFGIKPTRWKGVIESTAATIAIPFLSKWLQWGVQKIDGTVVPNSQIPSLTVHVQEEPVAYQMGLNSFPKYGSPTIHPEITKGKAGGYSG